MEHFHSTMKCRTNVIISFKNIDNTNLLADTWLAYYNCFKEHESLGNLPPVQEMGNAPFMDWFRLLKHVKRQPLLRAKPHHLKPI
ncbi:integrase core domain-containing protein [Chloroflexota bacterium]